VQRDIQNVINLQKYWHEQIALKASVFILWKVLTGSTDKLLAHYSPSNTLKTTMKKKRQPDVNSSQNNFQI